MLGLGHWYAVSDGDRRARALYNRHYSSRRYRDGRNPAKLVGPGEYMLLMTVDCKAIFGWKRFDDASGEVGILCNIFRNEGSALSSVLITEAEQLAWERWPGQRLYTYVNGAKIRSTNPGYCFLAAGWRRCGHSKGGLVILEKLPAQAGSERSIG